MARDDSDEFDVMDEEELDEEELDEGDSVEEEPDEEEPDEEESPRAAKPKVTLLTMILIFLNMAAALAFIFLMLLASERRQTWAYAAFERSLVIQGLPLAEEDYAPSGSRTTLPPQRLSGEALKAATLKRGVAPSKIPEPFRNVDEPLPHDIEPRHLTDEILKRYFADLGDPVRTLEDEVLRQKEKFPRDVGKAAQEHVEKVKAMGAEDKRRAEVRRVVLPVAYGRRQLEALLKDIDAARGDKLLQILEEGIQRRMFLEALMPMEVLRPGKLDRDGEKFLIASAGDLETYPLEELKRQFQKRMDAVVSEKIDTEFYFGKDFDAATRGSIDKREAIGMALLAVATVHGPDRKLLDPSGAERVRRVLGLWEFAYSAINYTHALTFLYGSPEDYERDDKGERKFLNTGILHRIHAEREGVDFIVDKDGNKRFLPPASFLAKHEQLVRDIIDLQRDLHIAQGRLKEMETQNALAEKTHGARKTHLEQTVKKLNDSRKRTADLVSRARELQDQLFEAQRDLIEAAEANYRLEQELYREQLRIKGPTP